MAHTTDLLLAGIRSHLIGVAPTELATCTFNLRDTATVKTYPLVVITDTGSDEHDVLRGVYRVNVEVALRSIPDDTTDAAHRTIAQQIWQLLADEDVVESLDSYDPTMRVWDVRCAGAVANEDDEYRQSVVTVECVVSATPNP